MFGPKKSRSIKQFWVQKYFLFNIFCFNIGFNIGSGIGFNIGIDIGDQYWVQY